MNVRAEIPPRPPAQGGTDAFKAYPVECGGAQRSLFGHLAMAAEAIAREGGPPGRAERYAAAAAQFRDMSYGPTRQALGPAVAMGDGRLVPVSVLLASAWMQQRRDLPGQSINADLLEAARELLLGLAWQLPES